VALDDLLGALEREAAAEVAALDAEARAAADRLVATAAERRERARRDALVRARTSAQTRHDTAIAEAARRGRGAVLSARAAALERLRVAASERLAALLAGGDGARILDRLVAAIVAVAGDRARLRCPPDLVAAVTARLDGRPGLTVEADLAVLAGVIADRDDGRVRIDATLGTLLERLWPRLRLEVRAGEAATP